MQEIMRDLADFCGFYFEATTFSQLFFFMFIGICGTCILAAMLKVMFYFAFRGKEIFR